MNHSNNYHNDKFQDKLKPILHVPKDFNLHKDSNFDKSVYKVPHFQDSSFRINNTDEKDPDLYNHSLNQGD